MSPFELCMGFQLRTANDVAVQRTGGNCPAAYRVARSRTELLEEAWDNLSKVVRRMKKYADVHIRLLEFKQGYHEDEISELVPQSRQLAYGYSSLVGSNGNQSQQTKLSS